MFCIGSFLSSQMWVCLACWRVKAFGFSLLRQSLWGLLLLLLPMFSLAGQ